MHAALVAYVLSAMFFWIPPRPYQQREYVQIAEACVVGAEEDPEDAVQLAAIASYESRFAVIARNPRSGAVGPFQLLGGRIPVSVFAQAREALRRWNGGMCSYTGEWTYRTVSLSDCPLAEQRLLRAMDWSHAHPFVAAEEVLARAP